MKKLTLLILLIFALIACNNPRSSSSKNTEKQMNTESSAVGGEKDEHGCLTAAGETWSELKQNCIKVFDVAQRLNPVEVNDGEAVISAFALFNDDKSKVELFLPETLSASVLDKSEGEIYQNDTYKFDGENSELYINNELKYKAE